MKLLVNQQRHTIPEQWHDEPLLMVLREVLGLFGTKFGCGQGLCGACTVLIDGQPVRSCQIPARTINGQAIETIEGLTGRDGALHEVQQAWLDAAVPQCGYCQSGQIMTAVSLLRRHPQPTDEQIDTAFANNLCRCGTHQRIRKAVYLAAGKAMEEGA